MTAKLNQAGDTIIEVLICMAIVGFALSVCYGIAHRSLYTIRQAEEHSQSLQMAKGQIERFRAYLSSNSSASTNPASPTFILDPNNYGFCILNDKSGKLILNKVKNDPKDELCAVNQAGVFYCEVFNCSPAPNRNTVDGNGYLFRAGIAYCHPPSCPGPVRDQFYALAGRYAVNGQTSNTEFFDVVSLQYRIHQ